ncbi:MAG: hypothetical protein HKO13_02535 [Sphingomonas sp.]|nr:hypothetical protein [Sphingomonas sp.]RZV51880.1 MAG: hypothetical protein EX258_03045 [Sphingomonadaceae bacterium]
MLKFLTIIFGLVYLVCVGLWTIARFRVFGFDKVEVATGVLEPLGLPWSAWFQEQLTVFTAPLVTFAILWFAAYLAKRNQRGHAR